MECSGVLSGVISPFCFPDTFLTVGKKREGFEFGWFVGVVDGF